MPAPLAIVLLPGPADSEPTLTSVREEAGGDAPLVRLDGAPPPAAEVLAAGDVLALVRSGDRWRPGALAARLRTFAAHPTAMLGVAGHVLVDAAGDEVLEVRAPMPPFDPNELLLRPTIEPAAVLVRPAALDEAALSLLTRPHGDACVWSGIVREHGLVPSTELAAEVRLDPDRHGHAPHARTAALVEAVRALGGEAPGAVTVRRELLRRLYVEPDPDPALDDLDLGALLGADEPARALVADLQWALERQRDALAAERIRWAHGEVAPDEQLPLLSDEELWDLRLKGEELWREILARNDHIARLEAELGARDAELARRAAETADAGRGA